MNLGTVDVYRKAEAAARCGDVKTLDACISELRHRKRGEDLIEDLEDLRTEVKDLHQLPQDLAKSFRPTDVADLTVGRRTGYTISERVIVWRVSVREGPCRKH